jgi:hypothetical protein
MKIGEGIENVLMNVMLEKKKLLKDKNLKRHNSIPFCLGMV